MPYVYITHSLKDTSTYTIVLRHKNVYTGSPVRSDRVQASVTVPLSNYQKELISLVTFVCPQVTAPELLEPFPLNFDCGLDFLNFKDHFP